MFVGVEANIETGSSILDARQASMTSIDTSPGAPGTTLNENRILGPLNLFVLDLDIRI